MRRRIILDFRFWSAGPLLDSRIENPLFNPKPVVSEVEPSAIQNLY
jgi:hypothetical protein